MFNTFHKRFFLLRKKNNLITNFIFPFFFKLIIIFFNPQEKNYRIYKHNIIEKAVRKKHIDAWKAFLKTQDKFLLVFEDDAICKDNSKERLKIILKKLSLEANINIFVDLAGGYKLNQILPKDLNLHSTIFDIKVPKLYTNTACTYLISRSVIKEFLKIVKNDSFSKNFPIDHLINYLGHKSDLKIYSGHFFDPIFTHGSFKDKIDSWQS